MFNAAIPLIGRLKSVLTIAVLACLGLGIPGVSSADRGVDSNIVGTWELFVPTPSGTSHWIWEIRPEGRYDFHAEGPGDTPAHSGTFSAADGRYTLDSLTVTVPWHDTGTYQLTQPDTMWAAGKAGVAAWHRVSPGTGNENSAQERRMCDTLGQYQFEPKAPFSNGPDDKPDFSTLPPGDLPGVACRVRYELFGPNRSTHSILYVVFHSQSEAERALKADASLDKNQKIVATLDVAATAKCVILSMPDQRRLNACETLKLPDSKQSADRMPPVLIVTLSPAVPTTAGVYDLPLQLDRAAAGEVAAAWELSD